MSAAVGRPNLISDPAFRREIEALHKLGPRVTGELIAELVHRHGADVRATTATFAAIDRDMLEAVNALIWPPMPLHVVGEAA